MICPECGVETVGEATFCHKCGARLQASSQIPPEELSGTPASAPAETPPSTPPTPAEQFKESIAPKQSDNAPEQSLWEGTFSIRSMYGVWVLCGLLTIVLLIVALYFDFNRFGWGAVGGLVVLAWLYSLLLWARHRVGVRYRLTSVRFFHETGLLRHITDSIELIDIDDVTREQGIIERILGVGTVRLASSDRTHPMFLIRGIDDVQRVAGLIDDARLKQRQRRSIKQL